jgi:hypothetical protein
MPWCDGVKLINKASCKRSESKHWDIWLTLYPHFNEKTFIPFDKFKNQKKEIVANKQLTKEEVIEQAEEIRKLHQGTHEGVRKE